MFQAGVRHITAKGVIRLMVCAIAYTAQGAPLSGPLNELDHRRENPQSGTHQVMPSDQGDRVFDAPRPNTLLARSCLSTTELPDRLAFTPSSPEQALLGEALSFAPRMDRPLFTGLSSLSLETGVDTQQEAKRLETQAPTAPPSRSGQVKF
jgi:hypothetical protein